MSPNPQPHIPLPAPTSDPSSLELLAPAGSVESFFAAIEAGADAVYCGLKEFSARAKAKNFTLAEMERLAAYARRERRRLYVTLNTLIKETELDALLATLAALAAIPVDAIIIQDLGLWRLARRFFPELPIHASTQMAVHNAAGVRMLEGMGFTRAVLARELTLDEIAAIRRQSTMELEHFVHGALCYSISGHCLFSSYFSGNSGNRGRCAQPCRRRYAERDKTGFYFSTSDLSAIALLPRLIAAGVMSFKIEGRMKNAEYVSTVVTAYRKVLNAAPHARPHAIKEAEALLAEAFGRATTPGLLKGTVPTGIAAPSLKGGIGRPLGAVEKVQGSAIVLTLTDGVHIGDRLRIQPEVSDRSGIAFTVQEMTMGNRPVKRADAGNRVRIGTPFKGVPLHAGDQVFKVATGKTFTLSAEACARRLASVNPPPAPVTLTISFRQNALLATAETPWCRLEQAYEVETEPADRSPLNQTTLTNTFAKTGHSELTLAALTARKLPPVAIKPSRLNEIRRDLYAKLAGLAKQSGHERWRMRLDEARAALLPAQSPQPAAETTLTVAISGPRDLALLTDQGIRQLIVPLTPAMITAMATLRPKEEGWRQRIVWEIPAIIYEGEWQGFASAISRLRQQGFAAFRLNNIGHFRLFPEAYGARLTAGPWLYALNSQAVLALAELGVERFTLSLEDDRANIAALAKRSLPIAAMATVFGPVPLVTSRIPLRGVRSGQTLTADSGEGLRLDTASGLTVAYADKEFSLLGRLPELTAAGYGDWVIDVSAAGAVSRRGQAVLTAARGGEAVAGATLFNYERGLA